MSGTRQSWQQGDLDFTLMYATHDAFRRDLDRLAAAAASGRAGAPGVRAGWEVSKAQLHVHHTVEDNYLWPRVKERAAAQPDNLRLLDELQAEHAGIDPLLAAVDAAFADRSRLEASVREASEALGEHLKHEEESGLPLIDAVCTAKDWNSFRMGMTRTQGFKGAMVYVPWVVDSVPPDRRRTILGVFPPPLRAIAKLFWEPAYRRRNLWKA